MTRTRKHGFTIIELMVGVAVITILISLLLSMLGRSRDNARQVICMSNQREIGNDMNVFTVKHRGQFPWLTTGGRWYHEEVFVCPADPDPVRLPGKVMASGGDDVAISFGFNPEYALFGVGYESVPAPSEKMLLYDGFGGGPNGSSSSGKSTSGEYDGDYFIDGNKVTITHLPPGNKSNGQAVTIGLSALAAHVGHNNPGSNHIDLFGNWTDGKNLDIVGYSQGDFLRRHPVGPGLGNVLFADGHAGAYEALDPSMYLFPDGIGGKGGNGGNGGNGNGNGGVGKSSGK